MRLVLLAGLALAAVLAAASPAAAYHLAGEPWPDRRVTYYVDARGQADEVVSGARAWNALKLGVKFARSSSRDRADVRIAYGQRGCGGIAIVGYPGRRTQSQVRIGRDCSDTITFLTTVHELGHVLGLGHEQRSCARMNPAADVATGTPNRCSRRPLSSWRATPLLSDDVRGARALYTGSSASAASAAAQPPPVWLP